MGQVDPAEVRALYARLRPMDTERPLIRLGGGRDGGYLVPDDLDGIAACFSPGVSVTATFEADLLRRGIPSFLADASVDGPPADLPACTFIKKFLGPKTEGDTVSLDDWVRENAPGSSDLILQMDIEGAEYGTVAAASPATMQRFRIVVMELHALPRWRNPGGYAAARPLLARLLDGFTVVHLHPNNCCGTVGGLGIEVPRLVEITLMRNDRVRGARPAQRFPHPLDRPNVGRNPDLVLPRSLWADDSPLFGGKDDGTAGQPVQQGVHDGPRGGALSRVPQDAGGDRAVGSDDGGGAGGGVAGPGATADPREPRRRERRAGRGGGAGERRLISTGSPFEARIGYSRAVVVDGWVFVAGTTGYDYATMTMPERVEDQCRNALATIGRALADAGGSFDDVVRVSYIVPDPGEWPKCWPLVAQAFATARPAATMISARLQEEAMKIEIEVTARLRG